MGGNNGRLALPDQLMDTPAALPLKIFVTNCQDLVNQENICIRRGSDRKRQTCLHASRISSDWLIDEFIKLGKVNNIVQAGLDLRRRQPHKSALLVNILST